MSHESGDAAGIGLSAGSLVAGVSLSEGCITRRDSRGKCGRRKISEIAFFKDECPDKFDGDDFWHHDERAPRAWKTGGEESLNRAEFLTALQACLGKLPERVSAVFLMREMDDVPGPEICETLGVSASNLWVMLHRARMALRQCLENGYFSPEPQPAA